MSRMTVLQLLPDLNVGGVERGTLEVANALVRERASRYRHFQPRSNG